MTTNKTYIRRNLSNILSPSTNKRAVWVNQNNEPYNDTVVYYLPSYQIEVNKAKLRSIMRNKSKVACFWLITDNLEIVNDDSLVDKQIVSFPNPKDFESEDNFYEAINQIKLTYPSLYLTPSGKVWG